MSMLRETRAKQEAAVEELRKFQSEKKFAPADRKEAIEADIVKKNQAIAELDRVIADLITNGSPKK